jgi:ribosomal protein L19E
VLLKLRHSKKGNQLISHGEAKTRTEQERAEKQKGSGHIRGVSRGKYMEKVTCG